MGKAFDILIVKWESTVLALLLCEQTYWTECTENRERLGEGGHQIYR